MTELETKQEILLAESRNALSEAVKELGQEAEQMMLYADSQTNHPLYAT